MPIHYGWYEGADIIDLPNNHNRVTTTHIFFSRNCNRHGIAWGKKNAKSQQWPQFFLLKTALNTKFKMFKVDKI